MNKNGNKNNSSADSSSSSSSRETNFLATFGLQRLTTTDDDNDDDAILVFQCKGNMEMIFQIPVVVRRMFGSGRKIRLAEEKVNAIITSQITKDMKESMDHWEDNFRLYYNLGGPR
jgi:hypothetical protein